MKDNSQTTESKPLKRTTLADIIKEYVRINIENLPEPCPDLGCDKNFVNLDVQEYAQKMLRESQADMMWLLSPEATLYATLCVGISLGYMLGKAHSIEELMGVTDECVN